VRVNNYSLMQAFRDGSNSAAGVERRIDQIAPVDASRRGQPRGRGVLQCCVNFEFTQWQARRRPPSAQPCKAGCASEQDGRYSREIILRVPPCREFMQLRFASLRPDGMAVCLARIAARSFTAISCSDVFQFHASRTDSVVIQSWRGSYQRPSALMIRNLLSCHYVWYNLR